MEYFGKTYYASATLFSIWFIWFCKINLQFHIKSFIVSQATNMIVDLVSLSFNLSLSSISFSIQEFTILNAFSINVHPPNARFICRVDWPSLSMFSPACDFLPLHYKWLLIVVYFEDIGQPSFVVGTLEVFFSAYSIVFIELNFHNCWHKLLLECDSTLTVKAFSNPNLVPRHL